MTTLKIIVLTVFIFLTIWLAIDITFIILAAINSVKNKTKYEKILWSEVIMLLIWSFCLSLLILL